MVVAPRQAYRVGTDSLMVSYAISLILADSKMSLWHYQSDCKIILPKCRRSTCEHDRLVHRAVQPLHHCPASRWAGRSPSPKSSSSFERWCRLNLNPCARCQLRSNLRWLLRTKSNSASALQSLQLYVSSRQCARCSSSAASATAQRASYSSSSCSGVTTSLPMSSVICAMTSSVLMPLRLTHLVKSINSDSL